MRIDIYKIGKYLIIRVLKILMAFLAGDIVSLSLLGCNFFYNQELMSYLSGNILDL
jgi:hypothetical protein